MRPSRPLAAGLAQQADRREAENQPDADDPEGVVDLFLSLVAGRQTTIPMLGMELDRDQIDQRIEAAVKLFLDGARKR